MSGSSTGTRMSRSQTLTTLSPMVHGICGFTWAITRLALAAADLTMSTEMPRLQRPWWSGGVTWMRATSSGMRPLSNRAGMSNRGRGVYSP